MFFRRRPIIIVRRPWLRRRWFFRPGCFTFVLLALIGAIALLH